MILEPIPPKVLSVRRIHNADPALLRAYDADPERHPSLGLVTCDQDDPTYVALDEATKHAAVDVVFARSFYAGAAHASGALSGEILGVLAGSNPTEVEEGLRAARALPGARRLLLPGERGRHHCRLPPRGGLHW